MADAFGRRFLAMACTAMACCIVAILAAGCAGTETASAGLAAEAAAKAPERVPAGKARLTLTRVSGVLYVGTPATVKINGEQVASLWAGSSSTVDIAPGANSVSVDAWSYPGFWKVDLNAKAGQAYAIEISPRGSSYVPSLLGPVGGAIDAAANENAGAFQMRVLSGQDNGKT